MVDYKLQWDVEVDILGLPICLLDYDGWQKSILNQIW